MKSATQKLDGKDLSFGGEIVYPNDLVNLRMGHMQIQENFTPGIGFVPRPGVKESYMELHVGPRPDRFGIMQLLFGTAPNFITGMDNVLFTREIPIMPLKIRFNSGDIISYTFISQYEYLEYDFMIYSEYLIPQDSYNYWYQSIFLSSAKRRNLYADLNYSWGDFYQGYRTDAQFLVGLKIAVPVFVSTQILHSDVDLGDERFVANIIRFNLNVLFSPDITLYSFVQYDSQSDNVGWQSRLGWIIQPGREIFFVWNSVSEDPMERFTIHEADARLKLKYTIRF